MALPAALFERLAARPIVVTLKTDKFLKFGSRKEKKTFNLHPSMTPKLAKITKGASFPMNS